MNTLYEGLPSSILDDLLTACEKEESFRLDLFEVFSEYDNNERNLGDASRFISLILKSILQLTSLRKTVKQITRIHRLLEKLEHNTNLLENLIISENYHGNENGNGKNEIQIYSRDIPIFCEHLYRKYRLLLDIYKQPPTPKLVKYSNKL